MPTSMHFSQPKTHLPGQLTFPLSPRLNRTIQLLVLLNTKANYLQVTSVYCFIIQVLQYILLSCIRVKSEDFIGTPLIFIMIYNTKLEYNMPLLKPLMYYLVCKRLLKRVLKTVLELYLVPKRFPIMLAAGC